MSRVCEICGKKPASGHNVSHSNRRTKRRWLPNLQYVRAITKEGVKRIRVCTTCIRSNKVKKAVYGDTNLVCGYDSGAAVVIETGIASSTTNQSRVNGLVFWNDLTSKMRITDIG